MKVTEYDFPSKYDKPFRHQVMSFLFALDNPRNYLFLEPGLGKTLIALWAADYLMMNGVVDKVLIVTPLSTIKPVWVNEILTCLPHRSFQIIHGHKKYDMLEKQASFYIINHDGVTNMSEHLQKKNFDLVVVDELIAFQNPSTMRSKALKRITDKAKGVFGMTGSPVSECITQAFGMARIVNPQNPLVPKTLYKFKDITMNRLDQFTFVPKPGSDRYVSQMLTPQIHYKRNECLDLPPLTEETREVPMSKEQNTAYIQLYDNYMAEVESGTIVASNSATRLIKLLQVSSGCVYDEEGKIIKLDCSPKLNELMDVWETIGKKKIIIFAMFTSTIKMLYEFMVSKGAKTRMIYGDINANERAESFDGFQNGDIDCLVIQPASAAHGLTLTACSTIVWFTPIYSNEHFTQACARITRAGQTNKQWVVKLSCSKADERVYQALVKKQNVGQALMDLFKTSMENGTNS